MWESLTDSSVLLHYFLLFLRFINWQESLGTLPFTRYV